jgi:ApeA N-terminal domain 1
VDSFEYDGIFWPADNPAQKVAGRLSYNPAEGAVLDLIGSFDEPIVAMSVDGPLRRINGIAGAKELTLDGAIPRGARLDGPGLLRQEYYVPVVLSGNHFTVQDSLDFDSVTLQFDQLPFWINRSNFTVAVDTAIPNNFSTATKIMIASEVPSVETESADGIDLELSSVSSVDGDRITGMRVGRIPCLSLSYKERRPLLEIITDINGLQDLITLAMDVPSVPTVIQLRRSDIAVKTGSDDKIKIPVDAYWANIAEYVRRAAPSNSTMFFSFGQIDGLAAVAKWITVSRKYRLVLGLLLSIRYSQRLYEENRFTNVISAAETFHRMRFENAMRPPAEFKSYKRKIAKVVKIALGTASRDWINKQLEHSNEPRLRERLIETARYAGPSFAQFVGQVETWSGIVTLLRNRLTHHEPSQRIERSPGDLNALTESLYIMTMLALMRECELPDDVFEGFQNSKRITAIREELAEITPRLAQYLRR